MKKCFWLLLIGILCLLSCHTAKDRENLILARIMDRLGFSDYPDARTIDRPKRYDDTKIFNVKRERNVKSGINLGHSVQVPYKKGWGRIIEENDFDAIRDAGFYYVRIPLEFMPGQRISEAACKANPDLFAHLDWIIESILERDMAAILDYHNLLDNGQYVFKTEEERIFCEENFFTFWKIISERYKEYPGELYFELANEPHEPITIALWNEFVNKAIQQIRNSGGNNKTRMIVIAADTLIDERTHAWDPVKGINELRIPPAGEDPNIIVTFHYYHPGTFAHQGEAFVDDPAQVSRKWVGNMWDNTERQKKLVTKEFDIVSRWAGKNNRKIMLGEFGVTIYADIDSRVNWIRFVREEAETRGMSWLFWGFYEGQSYGALYNQSNRYWNESILDALLPAAGKGDQGSIHTETSVRELTKLLKDPEWKIRKDAAIALMSLGPEAGPAVPSLIEALKDGEWQIRKPAAQALANIGHASYPAVPVLIGALKDEEWQVRKPAALALAAIGSASYPAVPALIRALKDEEWQVCCSAVTALGAIGPAAGPALPDLFELLDHEEWGVRKPVVLALAAIAPEDPGVLEALQRSSGDPEAQVYNTALIALGMIEDAGE